MDTWIDFASGRLFHVCLAICILGLAYRFAIALFGVTTAWRKAGDRTIPTLGIARSTLAWLAPVKLLRARPFYSAASILAHLAIIAIPLFSIGHVSFWKMGLEFPWPTLTPRATDALAVVAVVALASLLVSRFVSRLTRGLTKVQDVVVLLVLFTLALSGFIAAHPELSPVDPLAVMLAHILLGDLALVLTPTTKIAHCILFPFTQLTFELGWHFPRDTGRQVAVALGKEDEPV
jgi:nitrate reductase gamma subunit